MSAQVDETTVRQFIEIISAHARAVINGSGPPGVLQLSRLNPLDTNPEQARLARSAMARLREQKKNGA